MMIYIMPCGQKSDVIDVMLGIARHLYITSSRRGEGGVSQLLMFDDMGGGGGLETP